MIVWPFSRREPTVSLDAVTAMSQAVRSLEDARKMDLRAERVAESLAETRRVNHIATAVAKSIRGV